MSEPDTKHYDAERAARLLETLCDPPIVCVGRVTGEASPTPDPQEAALVADASPRRVADFLDGRACARAALEKLGLPPAPVLSGASREPLWPAGIVGSITHCAGLAAAAVARKAHVLALGIDAERAMVEPELEPMILSPPEREWLSEARSEARLVLRSAFFSIKESVFKCVFPAAKTHIDFRHMTVTLGEAGTFTAEISASVAVAEELRTLGGRYGAAGPFVLSVAFARAPDRQG